MSLALSLRNFNIKTSFNPLLEWVGTRVAVLKPLNAGLSESASRLGSNTLSEKSVYIRKVEFPTSSLAAAQASCDLMIDHLSPLTVDKIIWDLSGPVEHEVAKNSSAQRSYYLAIARKEAVEAAYKTSKEPVSFRYPGGPVFRFFLKEEYQKSGLKTLLGALFGAVLLFLSFWSLSQWETYFDSKAAGYNIESRNLAGEIAAFKAKSVRLQADTRLAEGYIGKAQTTNSLSLYKDLVERLPKDDSLSLIVLTPTDVEISGTSLDLDALRVALERIPNTELSLKRTSATNFSGQRRFKGKITKLDRSEGVTP